MSGPKNRLVIGGVDVFDRFGLVIEDGYEIPIAKAKTYSVDIPGASGIIDMSEAMGDIAYENRTMSFILAKLGLQSPSEFEFIKTEFANFVNGRKFDYSISIDPGYVYSGRFLIDENYSSMHIGRIKISIDTDPYKLKETCTYRVNAAGGIVITLESGRMPVCPTFEFASESIVACGDVYAQMQPGSYKVNDLWLHEGINEIYLNSYLGDGNVAAERYQDDTIAMHADKRISDLIWDGIRGAALIIEDWVDDTISIHADERIIDTAHAVSTDTEEFAVYIQYPWKDL